MEIKKSSDSISININELVIGNDAKYINQKYAYIEELGSGYYGTVWKVKNKLLNIDCAMKILERGNGKLTDEEINDEIEFLKGLDHPNILKIYDFYVDESKVYIVTEFCNEGDLYDEVIEKRKEPLSEPECAFIMRQILRATRYFHLMGIIHRDIKLANVMITKREENGFLQVKLIDFGLATFTSDTKITEEKGTLNYAAPEVLKKEYDEREDIWSLGVAMYKLLTKKLPFSQLKDEDKKKAILSGDYDKTGDYYQSLSDNAKNLIDGMLTVDPDKRISVLDALEHEWFKYPEYLDKRKINDIDPFLVRLIIKNLCSYKRSNPLKCAVLAYLVHNNTYLPACIRASKFFKNIDKNLDGMIDYEELKAGIKDCWGFPEGDADINAKKIFKNIDNDKDGFVSCEEFVRASINPKMFLNEKYLKFLFKFLDKNNSGEVFLNEVKEKFILKKVKQEEMIEEQLKKVLKQIGVNENTKINLEIFSKMIKYILKS